MEFRGGGLKTPHSVASTGTGWVSLSQPVVSDGLVWGVPVALVGGRDPSGVQPDFSLPGLFVPCTEISADFKDQSSPAGKEPPVASACSPPASSHPSSELVVPVSLGQPVPVGRLEDFLESSTGLPLLTAGHDGPEPLSLIDDLHSEMLSSSAILDHPPSPMDTSELHFAHEPSGGITLDLAEANLDSMDWLELPGGSVMSLAPLSTTAPSLFSTDFLDGHDLQLHWDSCL